MPPYLTNHAAEPARPILPLAAGDLDDWLASQPERVAAWVRGVGFEAKPDSVCVVPGEDGGPALALAGVGAERNLWSLAGLPAALPDGIWRIDSALDAAAATAFALGWSLATYSFERYRTPKNRFATLLVPPEADMAAVERSRDAVFLVRDLVNTPASDMGPAELAAAAEAVAGRHAARCDVLVGEALLGANYPLIHAVGRASERAPRLVDLRWGEESARKLTLVGKGVCFDSGGLDLKTAEGMRLMKKDMGGAAHVLGLASMIMAAALPVRLRVLIPAVENSVSANAMRPGDVIKSRKGLTVEIGNTDAEGRLVLCDALADADAEAPAMLIDMATLTGAARVALGPDLPALFANDDGLAEAILDHGRREADPVWRMPLWRGYRSELDSPVADLNNVGGRFGGAITAALFLDVFVSAKTPWAHLDIMAWNAKARPGRPAGGEALALRALYGAIADRFAR